jgi:hypothetical protein
MASGSPRPYLAFVVSYESSAAWYGRMVRCWQIPQMCGSGWIPWPLAWVAHDGSMGELHFQLEFEGLKGAPFPQLYVDAETLDRYARREGWGCEVIRAPDDHGHYLARLTP